MNDDSSKTLFHPFERGLIALPDAKQDWIFSGAPPGFVPPQGFAARLTCLQTWRPSFLALERQGHDVRRELEPGIARDGALVLLGRYREDNILRLREAALAVRPGGMIVVAGGKTDGVGPLRKQLQESLPGLDSASKHHGVAFWFEAPVDGLKDMLPKPASPVSFHDMSIPPGIFSADGPDAASVMLAGFFEGRLSGNVADFGAGWGYLGAQALLRCPQIVGLACYEADWRAIEACRENLVPHAQGRQLTFHWADVQNETPAGRIYDRVIMNPPFHDGRAARPEIGIGFIEAASRVLKPGGRLLMVANRNLPYEAALEKGFRRVERLAEANGFKVIEAVR